MHGWRQGRGLAHGAVAEILAIHEHGREHERHCHACHQMIESQTFGLAPPAHALPGCYVRRALVKGNRARGCVTRSSYRNRIEIAAVDRSLNVSEIDLLFEQLTQRRIVEQR